MGNPRRVCESVHILKILLCDLEWTGSDIWNIFPNQLARIDGSFVDLLQKEGPERLDTGAKEGAVERHVNSFQWNSGEASLQDNRPGLRLGLFDTFMNDLDKVSLQVIQGHALH